MKIVEEYLQELRDIRYSDVGTDELTYYHPLLKLLNEVGHGLKPKVQALGNLADEGAGHPDVGLFTDKQSSGQLPERGVIEVKGTAADVAQVAQSEQVARYLAVYHQVLVTNYWDFVLVGWEHGGPVVLESYRLAQDEAGFWRAAAHPRKLARDQGEPFVEYLKRVMLRPTVLSRPRDVAWFLASYARDALARLQEHPPTGLAAIRAAMEEALGLSFEGDRGERFFRSTLIQTLFYGIFSAWVLWHREKPGRSDRFNWHDSAFLLRVPVIQVLFEQLSVPSQLQALNLVEVLDWVSDALNRVDRAEFFEHFTEGEAVQYFYEPFLEAFSPQLRKELGVWYTPPEVVAYMVERVDAVLRQELGIEDGLADEDVVVLDPCCGTGAYLVAVLEKIAARCEAGGMGALSGAYVRQAATERVFGFEILPAPFVIAHLQLGLLLQQLNAPLATKQRAGVYLTNALTGWRPPEEPKQMVMLPELAEERDAAERVKRRTPVLVVLGNPPYNGFAGVAMDEERELSDAYRTTRRAPRPQGQGLNDLYVRFYRMAERCIVEMEPRKGVVCFISNYSWLDGLSFTGMRERYLEVFDRIWIDNLHGDRIISEYAPDGRTSETIFAIRGTSSGIKVGTAIALLTKSKKSESGTGEVLYRDRHEARADERRAALLASLDESNLEANYTELEPVLELGLPFKPRAMGVDYLDWPLLPDLFPVCFPGVKTSRDEVLVDIDRERLVARMEQYFDPEISHEEMRRIAPRVMESTKRFQAERVREHLLKRGFLPENVVPYCYRPFDVRWLYWEPETKLLDRERAEYFPHVSENNVWLASAQRNRRDYDPPIVTTRLSSLHVIEWSASLFPLYLAPAAATPLFAQSGDAQPEPNLSQRATTYLDQHAAQPPDLLFHAVAVLHAPTYRRENAGALRQDWPRVPLPATREALLASGALGRRVAALLDPERKVPGVTTGAVRPALAAVGVVAREGGGNLDPSAGDLALTAGWGYAGARGVTMPGHGHAVERDYILSERSAIEAGVAASGLTLDEILDLLGHTTYDVYLNDGAYWRNVPANVWEYTLGGYQVIKKWLSYRERRLLERDLKLDEVMEVTHIARRIAAIILMQPELDANYRAVKRP